MLALFGTATATQAELISLDPDLLLPQEAFGLGGELVDERLTLNLAIAPEYYLYRDRTSVRVVTGQAELGELEMPPGELITDEFFGEVATYRGNVGLAVPLAVAASSGDVLIEVVMQGCADYGVCYPPYVATLAIAPGGGVGELLIAPDEQALRTTLAGPLDNTSALQDLLANSSLLLVMFAFFNAGLLLAFTPCVLPMVPIVLAVTTRGADLGGGRAVALGLSYVLGMAVVYALMGVATAQSGALLAASLQTPWVIVPLVLLFAGLGTSILVGVNLKLLPAVVTNRLAQTRGQPGTFHGAIGAGALSAVVVSPCVAAPLVGALLFIAATGDSVTGGLALFALGLGMGMLPLACAAGAGGWLPRSGPLSEALRRLFGFGLLALAVWVSGALVVPAIKLVAYGIIALGAAWTLVRVAGRNSGGLARAMVWCLTIVLTSSGGIFLVGGLTGSNNELAPLAHLISPDEGLKFGTTVTSEQEYLAVYATVHEQGTLEYFTADWCISCREIEADIFANPAVAERLADYRLVKVDLTANTAATKRLLEMHSLFGPPALILRNGNRRQLLRMVGTIKSEQLLTAIEQSGAS